MKRPIPILLLLVVILGALYFITLSNSEQSSIENKVELMFKQKQAENSGFVKSDTLTAAVMRDTSAVKGKNRK